ncbi:MAG: hypothetical protein Q9162_001764 [Coniocarpon cinnabarinum]
MPSKHNHGVCQYDFGTKNQDEPLQILPGRLGRSPDVLVTAVAALQTKFLHVPGRNALGQALSKYVDVLVKEHSELEGCRRPLLDELYAPTYKHLDRDRSCEECDCHEDYQLDRPSRGRDVHPRIHQGLIASGNAVMRDAVERDRLADEIDVLCFEMEGGGLVTDTGLGCLVIRGICDYCDTHKNKGWQDYAAATAAAYAKELLSVVAPLEVPNSTGLNDNSVKEILDWLSDATYAAQQDELIERRESGTGEWFLNSASFGRWLKGEEKVLYAPGRPGAGKTFIACTVVRHIQEQMARDPSVALCYFYCRYSLRTEQTSRRILSDLLHQIIRAGLPEISSVVSELFATHSTIQGRPSVDEYLQVIATIAAGFSQCYIVIDALDELPDERGNRQDIMRIFSKLQRMSNANLLVTARPLSQIDAHFSSADPRLHIDSLRYVLNASDIKDALMRTPHVVLEQAYSDAVQRIEDQPPALRSLAKKVIMWLSSTPRALLVRELQHALVVREERAFSFDDVIDPDDLVSVCAGLVIVDERTQDGDIIRLLLSRSDVELNHKDQQGQTPLNFASYYGFEDVVTLLLTMSKVDVNARDNEGMTPLAHACERGHERIAKLLGPLTDPELEPLAREYYPDKDHTPTPTGNTRAPPIELNGPTPPATQAQSQE